jgi:DNA-binding LacI/PurR family transcriptional regulator
MVLGLEATGFVVGIDDIEEAALWRLALTTVSMPPQRVGGVAARLLLSRIGVPGGEV